jgi:Fe-S oxidoreductase
MGIYQDMVKNCIHGSLPGCAGLCPFHFDVRDFTAKLSHGRFDSAYRDYRNAVLFPEIVARLCPAPCRNACSRLETDAPIQRRLLERAAVQFAKQKAPLKMNIPKKGKNIAVIGAGIGGLSCALRMSERNYGVTVFEQSGRIGGKLRETMDSEVFLADIENQFRDKEWDLRLNTKITDLTQIKADAVYIATGKGGMDFGLLGGRNGCLTTAPGVFIGGELLGGDAVGAIRDGMNAADQMEGYLKVGRMEDSLPPPVPGGNKPDPERLAYTPEIKPGDDGLYTAEQAQSEAARCLRCDCDICQRRCPLMEYYQRYPVKIAELTEGTVWPANLFYNRLGTRMMASCDQCGICADACPQNVDVKSLILDARRQMVRKGAMPKAFADFWLADMAHANGESAHIVKKAEDGSKCDYVFFPGCQLGASDTGYVSLTYERLKRHYPGTALLTGCCGAPAGWAGYEELHAEVSRKLREEWLSLGSPVFICACPTCVKMLADTLPEIRTVSLYRMELGEAPAQSKAKKVSVFDPCASRSDPVTQRCVRKLLVDAGCELVPHASEHEKAACCGWGGQYQTANPELSRNVTKKRALLSEEPYVTYCTNCRDTFARDGKPVLHILDILLGLNDETRLPPTLTPRRRNRELLFQELMGEEKTEKAKQPLMLSVSPQLARKLSDRWLLESDLEEAVRHCETNGEKLFDPESGHIIGHYARKNMTFWVVYKPVRDGFELINAYAHRMKIAEES